MQVKNQTKFASFRACAKAWSDGVAQSVRPLVAGGALILASVVATGGLAHAQGLLAGLIAPEDQPLLEADKAFAADVKVDGENHALVSWVIADHYYMYRQRFAVTTDTPGVTIGELDIPGGKVKSDPAFGDVETYEKFVSIKVPLSGAAGKKVALKLAGQGCNEPVGVCYPPIAHDVVLDLSTATVSTNNGGNTVNIQSTDTPAQNTVVQNSSTHSGLSQMTAAGTTAASQSGGSWGSAAGTQPITSLSDLTTILGGGEPEFLEVDEAFKFNLVATGPEQLLADFVIADGYYLYRNQMAFEVEPSQATLGAPAYPTGKEKEDEFFGKTEVYYNNVVAPLPVTRFSSDAQDITVTAKYQGCAEAGICYPPVTKKITLRLPQLIGTANASTPAAASTPGVVAQVSETKTENSGGRFADKGFWGLMAAAFGIGVLLTFTPCVLPLIPILASVIGGQGETVTKARGGFLAAVYVLGTAVTYAAIGYVAGATGEQLQAYFQNVWAVGTLVVIFVVMSLSMFGLFELQMPGFLQSRLQTSTQDIKGGAVGGVFVLGLVSALIVGACVSPLLISALSVAIARGDAWLGASMMFALALGMGVFLIAFGFGAGHLMPKAGAWMDRVKQAFGVVLLGVAIYMLNIFPEVPVLLLWAALFIVVAVYLGATQSLAEGSSGWRYLGKGVGTVLLVWGIAAMLGGFTGNRDLLNPLPGFAARVAGSSPVAATKTHEELFQRVGNDQELDVALASAKASGKMVLLDYYADWCVDCKRMEATTLVDPVVSKILDSRFVMLQVDVTDPKDPATSALKKRYGVFGPPAILFFDTTGKEIKDKRLYGYRNAKTFAAILNGV